MNYYWGRLDTLGEAQPVLYLDRDDAFSRFKQFIACPTLYADDHRPPLTARAQSEASFKATDSEGSPRNLFIDVHGQLAANTQGQAFLDQFAPGSCTYWPVRLLDRRGVPFGGLYALVHTSQVVTAEYAQHEAKVWWGDKIGGNWCVRGSERELYNQLFNPVMTDWRPIMKMEYTKLSLPEVCDIHFWKSFVFPFERYYFSEEFVAKLKEGVPGLYFAPTTMSKRRWVPEHQIGPLLGWIEAKDERKQEWCRRYPQWVLKHRPEWFAAERVGS